MIYCLLIAISRVQQYTAKILKTSESFKEMFGRRFNFSVDFRRIYLQILFVQNIVLSYIE
jgi:hypothetical protein